MAVSLCQFVLISVSLWRSVCVILWWFYRIIIGVEGSNCVILNFTFLLRTLEMLLDGRGGYMYMSALSSRKTVCQACTDNVLTIHCTLFNMLSASTHMRIISSL